MTHLHAYMGQECPGERLKPPQAFRLQTLEYLQPSCLWKHFSLLLWHALWWKGDKRNSVGCVGQKVQQLHLFLTSFFGHIMLLNLEQPPQAGPADTRRDGCRSDVSVPPERGKSGLIRPHSPESRHYSAQQIEAFLPSLISGFLSSPAPLRSLWLVCVEMLFLSLLNTALSFTVDFLQVDFIKHLWRYFKMMVCCILSGCNNWTVGQFLTHFS